MKQAPDAAPAAKQGKGKRLLWWGLGGLFAIGAIGAALDPEAGKPSTTVAPDPLRVDEDNVDELREAMKPIGGQGLIFAFPIPATARPIDVETAARTHCAENEFCQVYGWQDASQLPGAWPMLDREVAALSFRYALNRSTGYEETSWFCGSVGAKPDCTKADAD